MVIKRPRFIQSQSSSQVYIWLDAHVYQVGMTITSHSNITSRLIPWGGWKLFHFVNGNPDGLKLLYKLNIYIYINNIYIYLYIYICLTTAPKKGQALFPGCPTVATFEAPWPQPVHLQDTTPSKTRPSWS